MRLDTSRLLHVKSDYRRGTMYYISTYDSSHRGNTSDRSFLGDFLGYFRCVNADEFLSFFHPGKPYKYLIVVKTFV